MFGFELVGGLDGVVRDIFEVKLVGALDGVVRDMLEVKLVEGLDEVVRENLELELVGEKKVGKKQSVVFVLTVDLLVVLYLYWFE